MAGDPSQNVHQDLLPHVHLLSTFRYAFQPRVELPEVTKWLTAAPKIARDTAPFFWTYLDCPNDGSIYLTWQPSARRGVEFSSDGYIWSGPEIFYHQPAGNGLVLEAYIQRSGFRPGEQHTIHSRKRFRLVPGPAPVPNAPQVDPNLWIVHYGPADKQDRIHVQMVSVSPQMQQVINYRQQLFQMGQIVKKEFMLSDRVNWPQLPLPGRGQSMYAPPMPPRHIPPTMAYPPHSGAVAGSSKRRGGHGQPPGAHPSQMAGGQLQSLEGAFDDEEDVSRGDLFDHLTPREVSIARYQQNHEWMEEILSSPYQIGQIEVSDLGLGRKGALASLTEGIFEAQSTEAVDHGPKKPYTGHLAPGVAGEFRKRVLEKNKADMEEIARMKADHEKALASLRKHSAIMQAEQDLRFAVQETGSEAWRLEGRLEDDEDGSSRQGQRNAKALEEILASVEKIVGKPATVVHDVHRVEDGGYQESAPEPEPSLPPVGQAPPMSRQPSQAGSQASGAIIGDSDIDMGGTAAGLLDQMNTAGGFSTASTPQALNLSGNPSSAATPSAANVASPQPPATNQGGNDINMEDADAEASAKVATSAPDQVPVASNPSGATTDSIPQPPTTAGNSDAVGVPAQQVPQPSSKPASVAPTPTGEGIDFSSLGDLDTAGEALAGYDPPSVGPGGDDLGDLNMDMEDSAFGDAFHGVSHSAGADQSSPGAGLGSAGNTPPV
ncbi:hypothetical protein QR685DRAFT_549097 [Neurospora intermedia]|uniref:DUF1750-domain-containing protein n=1 Tax=Neurospora intermedia TaxID=5142 RepID=A0ABR3DNR7_NEUIN